MRFFALRLLSFSLMLSSPAWASGGRSEVPAQTSETLGNILMISVEQNNSGEAARILDERLKKASPQSKLLSLSWRTKPELYELKDQLGKELSGFQPVGAVYLRLNSSYTEEEVQAILSVLSGRTTPALRVFIEGPAKLGGSAWLEVAQKTGASRLGAFQAKRALSLDDLRRSIPVSGAHLQIAAATLANTVLHIGGFVGFPRLHEILRNDPLGKEFMVVALVVGGTISLVANMTFANFILKRAKQFDERSIEDGVGNFAERGNQGLEFAVESKKCRPKSFNSTVFLRDVFLAAHLPCDASLVPAKKTYRHVEFD